MASDGFISAILQVVLGVWVSWCRSSEGVFDLLVLKFGHLQFGYFTIRTYRTNFRRIKHSQK